MAFGRSHQLWPWLCSAWESRSLHKNLAVSGFHLESHRLGCFPEPGLVLYLGLLVPIGLILIHNIITFVLVMRSLLKVREASRSQQIAKRLQTAVAISALVGLTWIFGFLAIGEATFAFQLIFCLANSLQGLVIFIIFCIRPDEVRSALAPYFSRFRRRLQITRSPRSNDTELVSTSAAPTSPSSPTLMSPFLEPSKSDNDINITSFDFRALCLLSIITNLSNFKQDFHITMFVLLITKHVGPQLYNSTFLSRIVQQLAIIFNPSFLPNSTTLVKDHRMFL